MHACTEGSVGIVRAWTRPRVGNPRYLLDCLLVMARLKFVLSGVPHAALGRETTNLGTSGLDLPRAVSRSPKFRSAVLVLVPTVTLPTILFLQGGVLGAWPERSRPPTPALKPETPCGMQRGGAETTAKNTGRSSISQKRYGPEKPRARVYAIERPRCPRLPSKRRALQLVGTRSDGRMETRRQRDASAARRGGRLRPRSLSQEP